MFGLSLLLVLPSIVLLRWVAQTNLPVKTWVLAKLHLAKADRTRKPRYGVGQPDRLAGGQDQGLGRPAPACSGTPSSSAASWGRSCWLYAASAHRQHAGHLHPQGRVRPGHAAR